MLFLAVAKEYCARHYVWDRGCGGSGSKSTTNRHMLYEAPTFYPDYHLEKSHKDRIAFEHFQQLIKIYTWYGLRSTLQD
jgi:hypothetical protein